MDRLRLIGTVTLAIAALFVASVPEARRRQALRPNGPFDPAGAPPAPDYSSDAAWAALPDRVDAADVAPPGAVDRQLSAAVDVFFVHPTTYLAGSEWNAAIDRSRVNELTATTSMRQQASIFNSAGRVFAPRYRQAVLWAYTHADDDSLAARDLAYADVAQAFDAYLERFAGSRAFILAGHSQGAHHLLRLLEERFASPELRHRLIAAYLIGVPLPADKLQRTLHGIGPCESGRQIGCLVSWNTVARGADRARFRQTVHHYPGGWEVNDGKPLVCVNPLSWRQDEEEAAARLPRAAVPRSRRGGLRRVAGPPAARCADGLLVIEPPRGPAFRLTAGRRGDYHAFDLPLFHMDVRHNAVERAEAFLRRSDALRPPRR